MTERRATSAAETAAFGAQLAAAIPLNATAPVVLYLTGDLGSGKTTLTQGFIRGCGITDAVRSPTYALMEPYEASGFTLLHLDLYRLRDPGELEALGLRDWAVRRTIWLIEWPEKGGNRLPSPDLHVSLMVTHGAHRITVTAASGFGRAWLRRIDTA